MSGRRRNEMPQGGSPGDGEPYRSADAEYHPGDDSDPFAPRPSGASGSDPWNSPYGGYEADPYESPGYGQGGFFGSQGGGLAGRRRDPGTGGGYRSPGRGSTGSAGYGSSGSTGSAGYGSSGSTGSGGYGSSGYGTGRTGGSGGYHAGGRGAAGSGSGGYGTGSGGYGTGSGRYGSGGSGSGSGGGTGGRGPDDSDADLGSAHGSGRGRRAATRRRSLSALIGPLAGAVGLAILLAAGVYALVGGGGCGDGNVTLSVVAAPEIEPAIRTVTASFNQEKHAFSGKCVKATVTSAAPSETATLLAGQGTAPGVVRPDVWIPDSSLWVTQVHSTPKGAASVNLTPTFVAKTPVVAATTRAFAAKIRNQGIRPTWDMLLKATDALAAGAVSKDGELPINSVHLQMLDPARNAAGLAAVVMTRMLLEGDPNAMPIFTQIVRTVQTSISPNTQALFAVLRRNLHGRAPVVIVPEQAVWKYNQANTAGPASVLYPGEGVLNLDYPFALATDDGVKVRAALELEKAMDTPQAHSAVRALGFRTADGVPSFQGANGLSPRVPRALPTPGIGDVTDVMQAWTKLSLRTRMLTLLDVSGSMAEPVAKGVTRMQATAQVAQGGLALFPDDTDLGLWTFSTDLRDGKDYQTEVPIGPLSTRLGSGTRRQAILAALGRIRPRPNGDTGLYNSVLAAVRTMRTSYKAGYYNTVLVLTDGKNDDPKGITLTTLLRTLKKESDPTRPVMVVFIGFGPDVDMGAMQKIAAETNGAAYHAMKPQEVQRIFLDTIARRICSPQCH